MTKGGLRFGVDLLLDGITAGPSTSLRSGRDDNSFVILTFHTTTLSLFTHPATTAKRGTHLPFVIPSAAEGSAALRTIRGNVFDRGIGLDGG